jgi:hypothetical protein
VDTPSPLIFRNHGIGGGLPPRSLRNKGLTCKTFRTKELGRHRIISRLIVQIQYYLGVCLKSSGEWGKCAGIPVLGEASRLDEPPRACALCEAGSVQSAFFLATWRTDGPAPSRNRTIRRDRTPTDRNWHSQIVSTFHPFFFNAALFSASRRTVRVLFSDQKSELVAGFNWPRGHECVCQKQPCTKIIFFRARKTRSGVPGKLRPCRRYRNPMACTRLLTAISGRVSLPRIAAMHWLRCAGVRESTISASRGSSL